jgi:hypothetical protein
MRAAAQDGALEGIVGRYDSRDSAGKRVKIAPSAMGWLGIQTELKSSRRLHFASYHRFLVPCLSMNVLAYFRTPFPSRQGFSAYRSPGPVAHLAFFLAIVFLGLLLCGPSPLLLVWAVAGIYLGRDLAILCHYAPLLFLLVVGALFAVFMAAKRVAVFGRQHPASGIGLTVLVLAIQIWVAWTAARSST